MGKRHRRRFTDEFKAETVKLIRESGRTVGSVARELDLTETAVRNWVKTAEPSGSTEALIPDERAELRRGLWVTESPKTRILNSAPGYEPLIRPLLPRALITQSSRIPKQSVTAPSKMAPRCSDRGRTRSRTPRYSDTGWSRSTRGSGPPVKW